MSKWDNSIGNSFGWRNNQISRASPIRPTPWTRDTRNDTALVDAIISASIDDTRPGGGLAEYSPKYSAIFLSASCGRASPRAAAVIMTLSRWAAGFIHMMKRKWKWAGFLDPSYIETCAELRFIPPVGVRCDRDNALLNEPTSVKASK